MRLKYGSFPTQIYAAVVWKGHHFLVALHKRWVGFRYAQTWVGFRYAQASMGKNYRRLYLGWLEFEYDVGN